MIGEVTDRPDRMFEGLTVMAAGSLEDFICDNAKEVIIPRGGKVAGSALKKTNYMIVSGGAGSKVTKVEGLGLLIFDEDRFKRLLETGQV